mgnify:CR=1 FL=1
MYTLILISAPLFTIGQTYDFSVKETTERFDKVFENTLSINIYEASERDIEKAWKSKLKDMGAKLDRGDVIIGEGANLKDIGNLPFNVYSKIEKTGKGAFKLYMSVDLGGTFLSSGEHPNKYKIFSALLKDFAIRATKGAIREELEEVSDELGDRQSDLEKLKKNAGKLRDDIKGWEKDIEKAEKDLEENSKDQESQEELIEIQANKLKRVKEKLESVK